MKRRKSPSEFLNIYCEQRVYSFSSLLSLALGLVILMASWAARSTITFLFLEETLWAISAQKVLQEEEEEC